MLPSIHFCASSPLDALVRLRTEADSAVRAWPHLPLMAIGIEMPLPHAAVAQHFDPPIQGGQVPDTITSIMTRRAHELLEVMTSHHLKDGETAGTSSETPGLDAYHAYLDDRLHLVLTREPSGDFRLVLQVAQLSPTQVALAIDALALAMHALPTLPRLLLVGTMNPRGQYPARADSLAVQPHAAL